MQREIFMKIHGLDQKSYIFSLCCLVFMLVVTDNKPLFLPVVAFSAILVTIARIADASRRRQEKIHPPEY
ncbi:hypothetical protein D934_10350 [Xylella fastidiosa subsp. sandyi Ann-1]|uniref:Uncharacterized protein n=1 Tax=Xylella fastidiosa subsp. sandyi Ann-1 TaxID=155920 RepID=A0A060H430_XYLFS|nr:hypothetical protein D934_10350 [Xylella fastidiosa subsp. sandyi Ann-1]